MSVHLTAVTDEPIRFGYSARDIDRYAGLAMRLDNSTRGLDPDDRREAAWFGVVEALYAAGERPDYSQLVYAGRTALLKLAQQDQRQNGVTKRPDGQYGAMPNHLRYWLGSHTREGEPAFVTSIVDRTALVQVFAELTEGQGEALLALGAHGDYARAAAALEVSEKTFWERLDSARKAFLALWYEHETPRYKVRGRDQRSERRSLRPRVAAVFTRQTLPAVLADVRQVFVRRQVARMHSVDVLAGLQDADPERYGRWDQRDLADALRWVGVRGRQMEICDPAATSLRNGRSAGGAGRGFVLDDVVTAQEAADGAADGGAAGGQGDEECAVLADLLKEISFRRNRAKYMVLELIQEAGAEGTTTRALTDATPGGIPHTVINGWVGQFIRQGRVTRLGPGRYAPAVPATAPAAVPAAVPAIAAA